MSWSTSLVKAAIPVLGSQRPPGNAAPDLPGADVLKVAAPPRSSAANHRTDEFRLPPQSCTHVTRTQSQRSRSPRWEVFPIVVVQPGRDNGALAIPGRHRTVEAKTWRAEASGARAGAEADVAASVTSKDFLR